MSARRQALPSGARDGAARSQPRCGLGQRPGLPASTRGPRAAPGGEGAARPRGGPGAAAGARRALRAPLRPGPRRGEGSGGTRGEGVTGRRRLRPAGARPAAPAAAPLRKADHRRRPPASPHLRHPLPVPHPPPVPHLAGAPRPRGASCGEAAAAPRRFRAGSGWGSVPAGPRRGRGSRDGAATAAPARNNQLRVPPPARAPRREAPPLARSLAAGGERAWRHRGAVRGLRAARRTPGEDYNSRRAPRAGL